MANKKPLAIYNGELAEVSSSDTLDAHVIVRQTTDPASTTVSSINAGTTDLYRIAGLTQALTVAAPTGTPTAGQPLEIYLTDSGVARALAWAVAFAGSTTKPLPTTTVVGADHRLFFQWDELALNWDLVAAP
jgi:hypothetical protein